MTKKDMVLALRSGLAVLGLIVLPFLGLLLCDVPGIAEVEVFTKTPSSVRIGTYQTDRTGISLRRSTFRFISGCSSARLSFLLLASPWILRVEFC